MYSCFSRKVFRMLFSALLSLAIFLLWMACLETVIVYADCQDPDSDCPAEEAMCQSHPNPLVEFDTIPDSPDEQSGKSGLGLQAESLPKVQKSIPMAVIVIGFGGNSAERMPYNDNYDWYSAIFSHTGYSGKTVREYYRDQSYGQFSFDPVEETSAYGTGGNTNKNDKVNDGIVHVNISNVHKDWSVPGDAESKKAMGEAFAVAVKEAAKYVDFPKYDINGNKTLDPNEFVTAFIVGGYDSGPEDTYQVHGVSKYMRSHQWRIEYTKAEVPTVTKNGKSVSVNYYVAVSERIERDADGNAIELMGRRSSLAHELGHHLGLPDLYDRSDKTESEKTWKNFKVGYTSLMGDGSWGVDVPGLNGTRYFLPYSLDPWSKIQLGWAAPEVVDKTGVYSATGQDYTWLTPNHFVKIPVKGHSKEYYLIEARALNKWDAGMDYRYDKMLTNNNAGGLVIWHIDEQVLEKCKNKNGVYENVNNTHHRPAVMPVFIEKDADKYTMTSSGAEHVYTLQPFFDMTKWKRYASAFGADMPLATYGGLDISSKPDTRKESGARIEFLDNADRVMTFRYISPDHEHKWTDKEKIKFSTDICEKGGTYVEYCECTSCGQRIETKKTAGPGHYPVFQSAIEPTCEKRGHVKYYECEACEKKFADWQCTEEYTSDDDIYIPPLGHDWYVEDEFVAPTYDSEGENYEVCSRCGEGRWVTVPMLDRTEKMGHDGTPIGEDAAIEAADPFLTKYKSEKDPAGSKFSRLTFRSVKQTNSSITLRWNRPDTAYKTIIYGSICGKSNKLKKIKEIVEDDKAKITKVSGKKLKKGTYYKFIAVAVTNTGNVVSTSKQIHVSTRGSKKKSNNTGVYVSSKIVKKAAKLKKGKTLSLKAKAKTARGCRVSKHVGLRYESTAKSVVKVLAGGKIKAVGEGTCYVYAYAQNGSYKKIKVKVK
ncbi:MAG: immune inhibitor A [Eubacterium sp.]|nr:immune inhibitor A [Eubacterium sp.]